MRKCLCGLIAAVLALALSIPALAIVPAPENTYVGDYADVLSEETEQYIITQNQKLTQATGGAIVIVTVDFMDGMESADYAYECFNTWQIGDKDRNNGVLLVYAVGENRVWSMAGVGIEDALSADILSGWLEQYFYGPYDAGDYDRGTRAYFDVVYGWFDSYYGGIDVAIEGGENQGSYLDPVPGGGTDYIDEYSTSPLEMIISVLKVIGALIVLIVLVVVFAVLQFIGRGSPSFSRGYSSSHRRTGSRPSSRPRPSSSHRSSSSGRSGGFGGGRTRGGGAGR